MPIKDFQRHLHQHLRCCNRAKAWAEKAIEHAKAGNGKRAQQAQNNCSEWLKKAMEIERKYKLRNPHEVGK